MGEVCSLAAMGGRVEVPQRHCQGCWACCSLTTARAKVDLRPRVAVNKQGAG